MANIGLQLDFLFDNSRHIYENSSRTVEPINVINKKQVILKFLHKEMDRKLWACVQHHRVILKLSILWFTILKYLQNKIQITHKNSVPKQ